MRRAEMSFGENLRRVGIAAVAALGIASAEKASAGPIDQYPQNIRPHVSEWQKDQRDALEHAGFHLGKSVGFVSIEAQPVPAEICSKLDLQKNNAFYATVPAGVNIRNSPGTEGEIVDRATLPADFIAELVNPNMDPKGVGSWWRLVCDKDGNPLPVDAYAAGWLSLNGDTVNFFADQTANTDIPAGFALQGSEGTAANGGVSIAEAGADTLANPDGGNSTGDIGVGENPEPDTGTGTDGATRPAPGTEDNSQPTLEVTNVAELKNVIKINGTPTFMEFPVSPAEVRSLAPEFGDLEIKLNNEVTEILKNWNLETLDFSKIKKLKFGEEEIPWGYISDPIKYHLGPGNYALVGVYRGFKSMKDGQILTVMDTLLEDGTTIRLVNEVYPGDGNTYLGLIREDSNLQDLNIKLKPQDDVFKATQQSPVKSPQVWLVGDYKPPSNLDSLGEYSKKIEELHVKGLEQTLQIFKQGYISSNEDSSQIRTPFVKVTIVSN